MGNFRPFSYRSRSVEDDDEEGRYWAQKQGQKPPEQSVPAFALRKACVDQRERSPPRNELSRIVHIKHPLFAMT